MTGLVAGPGQVPEPGVTLDVTGIFIDSFRYAEPFRVSRIQVAAWLMAVDGRAGGSLR